MFKKLELSDYQLWMCSQIREKLAESNYVNGTFPANAEDYEEREVISIALSEMLLRLSGFDHRARKIDDEEAF
ncbi:hypothetical protein [Mesobacillus harenae]|uniref:hypothetical protein n=1 Tax=Mesobacillus harenae TaxID=2213203 RepID=UPI00157FF05D|nr:hypothetical protein [Mesobacillus harenae]